MSNKTLLTDSDRAKAEMPNPAHLGAPDQQFGTCGKETEQTGRCPHVSSVAYTIFCKYLEYFIKKIFF